jgi:pyrroline-5-carboxylate reductase
MKCGFLGHGNMGRAIVNALLEAGSLEEQDVEVYNRSPERLNQFRSEHPGAAVAATPAEAAGSADVLFICIDGSAVFEVIASAQQRFPLRTHLVTINGGLGIAALEAIYDGPVSKVIPTMKIRIARGITLVAHGTSVSARQAAGLEALFARSGKVVVLPEARLEVVTELTSCGPGLMAQMMAELARSAARTGMLNYGEALEMVTETMMGTALMLTGCYRPDELASRVASAEGSLNKG